MVLLNLNFDELLGLFLGFSVMVYVSIVVFNGILSLFRYLFDEKIDRLFHYHYHYKNRRKWQLKFF